MISATNTFRNYKYHSVFYDTNILGLSLHGSVISSIETWYLSLSNGIGGRNHNAWKSSSVKLKYCHNKRLLE